MADKDKKSSSPKYEINYEGKLFNWDKEFITASELRSLIGLPENEALLVINLSTGDEEPFPEDEEFELKPGHGFSKKVGFKRG